MGSAIGVQWSGTTEEVWAVITVGQSTRSKQREMQGREKADFSSTHESRGVRQR